MQLLLPAAAFLMLLLLLPLAAHAAEGDDGDDGDMNTLRSRLIRSVIPDDPAVIARLKKDAAKHAASLRSDHTWADVNYADESRTYWGAQEHARRVLAMSKGVRISIDAGAIDKDLLARTHAALDYWLDKDFRNPNWWHNEIGTPELIGETAVLLQPQLTPPQRDKILEIMRRSNWTRWTGQNLVWGCANQVMRGLIENDAGVISAAFDRMYDEIRVSTGEGIQPDWSFHQHRAQFYSGGYGLQFAQDVPRYAACAFGTRWQMPPGKLEIFNHFMLDGQRWMMHFDRFDYSAVGREITRRGKSAVARDWEGGPISPRGAAYSLLNAVNLFAAHPIPRQQEYHDWAATLDGKTAQAPLVGNRHYWRSDYMAHHAPRWFASVRMYSTRLINTEFVNDEGKLSHHLADGANFLYVTGNEYTDIFPAWDWTRIPGVTAQQQHLAPGDRHSIGIRGMTSFVGGVSDGSYGFTLMDFAARPAMPLRARKSVFFFDTTYTALGAGITCDSDIPVTTSINQCHLAGDVRQGGNWIHHANVGYVFPTGRDNVKFTTGIQRGDWADIGTQAGPLATKVFSLWLAHGANPANVTYAYTVFPASTPDETARLADHPEVQIIANTPKQQAVYHARLKMLGVAFYEPGRVEFAGERTVEVDRPCALMIRDGRVWVANPANEPMTLHIKLDGEPLTVELPDGDLAGSSIEVK